MVQFRLNLPIGRIEMFVCLVMLVMLRCAWAAPAVLNSSTDQERYTMQALDCLTPTEVRNGLLSSVCNTTGSQATPSKPQTVLVLQYSTQRVIHGYKCEKFVSRYDAICGAFSHTKVLSPPDVRTPVPFPAQDCATAIKRQSYVREDGTSVPIEPNRRIFYKFTEYGSLTWSTDNVACTGSSITVNGQVHNNVLSLVTAEVLIKSISIEIDIGKAKDMDSLTDLPSSCSHDLVCQDGMTGYVLEHQSSCPLYTIRTLPMTSVRVKSGKGEEQDALVSHEHKLLLVLQGQEAAHPECRPIFAVQATTFKDIKVVTESNDIASIQSMAKVIPASSVDLDLELRSSEEYVMYAFETILKEKLGGLASSLCRMNTHGLSRIEVSPFHPHALLRVRGELLQELVCTPVTVEVRIGDSRGNACYADALPAWYKNSPVLIQAGTHLISTEAEIAKVTCEATYTPVFMSREGKLLQASPDVQTLNLEIGHLEGDFLHLSADAEITHTSFKGDLLYTASEVAAFNDLVHFARSRERVVDAMVGQYCATGDCGLYTPSIGSRTFNLENLEDQLQNPFTKWFSNVSDEVAEIGYWCSICIVVYTVLKVLHRIYALCTMRFRERIPMGEAFDLAFFLERRMRRSLVNYEASRREEYAEVAQQRVVRKPQVPECTEEQIPMVNLRQVPVPRTVPRVIEPVDNAGTELVPYMGSPSSTSGTSRNSRYWS